MQIVPLTRRFGGLEYKDAGRVFSTDHLAEIVRGGPYANAYTGQSIGVTGEGLRHADGKRKDTGGSDRRTAERLEALANLPELLRSAVPVEPPRPAAKKTETYREGQRL